MVRLILYHTCDGHSKVHQLQIPAEGFYKSLTDTDLLHPSMDPDTLLVICKYL